MKSYDILLLQEIWLYEEELPLLNSFHVQFHGTGVAVNSSNNIQSTGRPRGGVCILWKKSIESVITELKYDLDWLVGVRIKVANNRHIVLLCVYLHYCAPENEDEFLMKCAEIRVKWVPIPL